MVKVRLSEQDEGKHRVSLEESKADTAQEPTDSQGDSSLGGCGSGALAVSASCEGGNSLQSGPYHGSSLAGDQSLLDCVP